MRQHQNIIIQNYQIEHSAHLRRIFDVKVRQPLHVLIGRVSRTQIAVENEQPVQNERREEKEGETDPRAMRSAHLRHRAALKTILKFNDKTAHIRGSNLTFTTLTMCQYKKQRQPTHLVLSVLHDACAGIHTDEQIALFDGGRRGQVLGEGVLGHQRGE
jgi:hypothetical protein